MLKRKALRKMFITTMTVFILLAIYLIPNKESNPKDLDTSLELEYITGLGTNDIYLLNKNKYLVRVKVLIDSNDPVEQVKKMVSMLTVSKTSKFPNEFTGVLPQNIELKDVTIDEGIVTLHLSKDFLKLNDEDGSKAIESLTHSILDIENLTGLSIMIDNNLFSKFTSGSKNYPPVLTKKDGINKEYDLTSRHNVNRVVVYYTQEIDNERYYVPVTKYVNTDQDKVKIIVDELTSNYIYEPNLMSFLNQDTKLLNYQLEDDKIVLNFNDAIFTNKQNILEEVIYTIAYSVFDTYDISQMELQVNNESLLVETKACMNRPGSCA